MKTATSFSRLTLRMALCMLASLTIFASAYADCTYLQKLKAEEFAVGVMLSWKTSAENNNLVFEIEKSTDGKDFVRIGSLDGSGNSLNAIPYRFLDVAPKDVKNIYRLRQIDKDGSARLSEVTLLKKEIKSDFAVVQLNTQPANNAFKCTVDADKAFDFKATVKNALGETLVEYTKRMEVGLNHLTVDISKLPEGPYKIIFKNDREEKSFMVWKTAQEPDVERNIALVKNN